MGEMKVVWEGNYTNLRVVRLETPMFPKYNIWLHGDKETELPGSLDNVTFTQNTVTVFDFTGNIFAGGDSKLNLKIYEQDNGVVRGEIRLV
jgi:hypothetical protein